MINIIKIYNNSKKFELNYYYKILSANLFENKSI